MKEISLSSINRALLHPKIEVMNFLNEITSRYPEAISFAPGRPREDFFDVRDAIEHISDFVDENGTRGYAALGQYGRTNGIIGNHIANLLKNDEQIDASSEDIIVTVGCQEAMCLILLTICSGCNDVVMVVNPAYIGICGAAHILGIQVAPVATIENALDLEKLEQDIAQLRLLGKSPKILYLSPEFANPTGISLDRTARTSLLALTKKLGITVVEDHAYNYFWYDEAPLGALKSMPGSEHVIYLGSFSKSIFPGLRIGFVHADQRVTLLNEKPGKIADEISKVKSLVSVNTSPINQAIVGGILIRNNYSLRSYVEPRRIALRENRDTLIECLENEFEFNGNRGVSWNIPTGGFFLCLTLPFAVSEQDLLSSCGRYGVIWVPMSYFSITNECDNQIRLSFSYLSPSKIQLGVAALARFVCSKTSLVP